MLSGDGSACALELSGVLVVVELVVEVAVPTVVSVVALLVVDSDDESDVEAVVGLALPPSPANAPRVAGRANFSARGGGILLPA
jgi:hypothetical protein